MPGAESLTTMFNSRTSRSDVTVHFRPDDDDGNVPRKRLEAVGRRLSTSISTSVSYCVARAQEGGTFGAALVCGPHFSSLVTRARLFARTRAPRPAQLGGIARACGGSLQAWCGTEAEKLRADVHHFCFWRALIGEFLGTIFLVGIGAGSSTSPTKMGKELAADESLESVALALRVSLAFGLTYSAALYCLRRGNDGHLNSSVSLAMAVTGRIGIFRSLLYIVAQILGAVIGASLIYGFTPSPSSGASTVGPTVDPVLGGFAGEIDETTSKHTQNVHQALLPGGCTVLGQHVTGNEGFLVEFLASFVLVFVLFSCYYDPAADDVTYDSGASSDDCGAEIVLDDVQDTARCIDDVIGDNANIDVMDGGISASTREKYGTEEDEGSDDITRRQNDNDVMKDDVSLKGDNMGSGTSGTEDVAIPFVIGLTLIACSLFAIPYTGGSMNTARSFGLAIVQNVWTNHWVYWFGPILGGITGGGTHELLFCTSAYFRRIHDCFRRCKRRPRPLPQRAPYPEDSCSRRSSCGSPNIPLDKLSNDNLPQLTMQSHYEVSLHSEGVRTDCPGDKFSSENLLETKLVTDQKSQEITVDSGISVKIVVEKNPDDDDEDVDNVTDEDGLRFNNKGGEIETPKKVVHFDLENVTNIRRHSYRMSVESPVISIIEAKRPQSPPTIPYAPLNLLAALESEQASNSPPIPPPPPPTPASLQESQHGEQASMEDKTLNNHHPTPTSPSSIILHAPQGRLVLSHEIPHPPASDDNHSESSSDIKIASAVAALKDKRFVVIGGAGGVVDEVDVDALERCVEDNGSDGEYSPLGGTIVSEDSSDDDI